jgi:hypothetical protein
VVNTINSWKDITSSASQHNAHNKSGNTASTQFDPRQYSNLVLVNNKNHNNQLLQKTSTSTTAKPTTAAASLEQQRHNGNNYEYANSNKPSITTATVTANNRNDRMRIFVALFDYDPPTMSPNPDACEEELPFREGQLIKVYGEKDSDGFYWGEAAGKVGFVPCNMVSEVQVSLYCGICRAYILYCMLLSSKMHVNAKHIFL